MEFQHSASQPLVLAPGAAMRWAKVSKLMNDVSGPILEIGCGKGGFAARVARKFDDVTALEPDGTSFEIARQFASDSLSVLNKTTQDLPEGLRFNTVCSFEVLEHLPDDRKALSEWLERLAPGGTLIVSVPAHQDRFGAWDEMVGHYRRYDPAQMEALLTDAGLTDIELVQYGYPFGPLLENIRNLIAQRQLNKTSETSESLETRTASSGRQLQPDGKMTQMIARLVNPPCIAASGLFPNRGVGLIAKARLPK